MLMPAKYPWIRLKFDVTPNELICNRCGQVQPFPEGNPFLYTVEAILKSFGKVHKNCKES